MANYKRVYNSRIIRAASVCLTLIIIWTCKDFLYQFKDTFRPEESYWIWAGETIEKEKKKHAIYLYQGRFERKRDQVVYTPRGLYPHETGVDKIFLVFRFEVLDLGLFTTSVILDKIRRWEERRNNIAGVQLDFDSPTSRLLIYSQSLAEMRRNLPGKYRISITGLADWLISSDLPTINKLGTSVDEVVFQLYHQNHWVPNLSALYGKLEYLQFPFQLGLRGFMKIDDGELIELNKLNNFKGFIYFK